MVRFFVAEDNSATLHQLKQFLVEEFVDAQIDGASTVENGMECIRSVVDSGCSYDVAVLDFKLPLCQGDNPEIDESLCGAASLYMPNALIVHISGFGDEPMVREHLAKHTPRQGYPVLISKLLTAWPDAIVTAIRQFIHSMRIDEKMDRLLWTPRGGGRGQQLGRRAELSLTSELDDLMQDIVAHWDDLDAPLRLRVEQAFEVDKSTAPLTIAFRGIRPLPQLDREDTGREHS